MYNNIQKLTLIKHLILHRSIAVRILFSACMLYTMLAVAWVGDDILITARQISNFIIGNGITFNYETRVQAFTHPSWFLILSSIIYFTNEYFLTIIFVSITLSMFAIFMLFRVEKSLYGNNLPIISPIYLLLFSWAFCDYTTSGLENPISYFLVSCLLYLHSKNNYKRYGIHTFICLSLLVLTRIDHFILFLPYTIVVLLDIKDIRHIIRSILPGTIILIVWFTFATIYFGSPLPNTYFAKLMAGYPTDEVYDRGLEYIRSLLRSDLASVLIIISTIFLSIISLNRYLISFIFGVLLYIVYIYNSGGDFMSGRFFATPTFLCVGTLIFLYKMNRSIKFVQIIPTINIILLLGFYTGLFHKFPTLSPTDFGISESRTRINLGSVIDERAYYYYSYGLMSEHRRGWPKFGEILKQRPTDYRLYCGGVGLHSMLFPNIYLVDQCGLSDPFIARLPAIQSINWRIGHHVRKVPTNFGEYLSGDLSEIPDKKLRNLFKDVKQISMEEIFSVERFGAIWRLNTGYYGDLDLSDYRDKDLWLPSTTKLEVHMIENGIFSPLFPQNENFEIIYKHYIFSNRILINMFHNELTYDVYLNNDYYITIHGGDGCLERVIQLPQAIHMKKIKFHVVRALPDAVVRTTHVKEIRPMNIAEIMPPDLRSRCIYHKG